MDVVSEWRVQADRFGERIGGRFARAEPRERVTRYLRGVCALLGRRNGWTIAEHAGEVTPDGMQRLLRKVVVDVDGIRDDLRDVVVEHWGDPDAVLVFDDTGFEKKGTESAGVQRQYSGTTGRVENCQVGVFAAYVSPRGHALIDRELYLPHSWTDDRARCQRAGIPDDVQFATKPQMALRMLKRIVAAKVPLGWVSADEGYGRAKYLRDWLEEQHLPYVMAIACDDYEPGRDGQGPVYAEGLAQLPARKWKRISAGAGAHGHRYYDWVRVPVRANPAPGDGHWIMARRSISDPTDIAYYICYAPARTSLKTLARVAGRRWPIEECFQQAKNEAGLDEYQVRTWRAWYAHITLSMAAHALLAITRATITANPQTARKWTD